MCLEKIPSQLEARVRTVVCGSFWEQKGRIKLKLFSDSVQHNTTVAEAKGMVAVWRGVAACGLAWPGLVLNLNNSGLHLHRSPALVVPKNHLFYTLTTANTPVRSPLRKERQKKEKKKDKEEDLQKKQRARKAIY